MLKRFLKETTKKQLHVTKTMFDKLFLIYLKVYFSSFAQFLKWARPLITKKGSAVSSFALIIHSASSRSEIARWIKKIKKRRERKRLRIGCILLVRDQSWFSKKPFHTGYFRCHFVLFLWWFLADFNAHDFLIVMQQFKL